MKITDYSRSTLGIYLGTASNANAIGGVRIDSTTAVASNYHLVASSSNTAQWVPNTATGVTVAEEDGSPSVAASTIEVPNGGMTDDTGGVVSLFYAQSRGGGREETDSLGTLGATETLNVALGNAKDGTLDQDCTIGFTGWPASGTLARIEFEVTENGTGGWTPTFTGVTWLGGTTPTHDTTAGTSTIYLFWSRDGGTTITGSVAGSGGSGFVLSHPSTSSNSFTSNAVLTNDASMAVTMPQFGTLHFSAPFYSEVVTDQAEIVWHGDDVVHDLVRLY